MLGTGVFVAQKAHSCPGGQADGEINLRNPGVCVRVRVSPTF